MQVRNLHKLSLENDIAGFSDKKGLSFNDSLYNTVMDKLALYKAEDFMTEDEIKGTIFDSSEYGTVVNQVAQTANELSVTRTEIFGEDGLEERVSVIESGVHISGSNIGIWSSDSPFQMNIDNTGWEITESGQPTIVARESKMIAPRVQITDAFMIGSLALRSSGGHMRLLKYGGGN